MNHQQALQEMGINQIRVINRFFDLKLEVLFALMRQKHIGLLYPAQNCFSQVGRSIEQLMRQVAPVPAESRAEQVLRLRGCNALRRTVIQTLEDTRHALITIQDHLPTVDYSTEEWDTLMETFDSLIVITESNLYLLENSQIPEELF